MNQGQELYELHKAGKDYLEIAGMFGFTKGKVAGTIYRYKKANGITTDRRKVSTTARAPKKKPQIVINVKSLNLTLKDIKRGQCIYPYGEGPYTFCGHPIEKGSPYCEEHHAICHTGKRVVDPCPKWKTVCIRGAA